MPIKALLSIPTVWLSAARWRYRTASNVPCLRRKRRTEIAIAKCSADKKINTHKPKSRNQITQEIVKEEVVAVVTKPVPIER
jgi:hypothetical protein